MRAAAQPYDDQTYPHLDLPRGVELTKEEVSIATEGRAFSSSIASINNSNNLAHSSFDQAMNDLIAFAEVDTLCFTRLTNTMVVEVDCHRIWG